MDKDLRETAPGNVERSVFEPAELQPLLHAGKTPADEGDMMDHAGIRLLRLIGPGNIDQMHHRLALRVHPGAGEGKVRPGPLLQAQNILIKPTRPPEFPRPHLTTI